MISDAERNALTSPARVTSPAGVTPLARQIRRGFVCGLVILLVAMAGSCRSDAGRSEFQVRDSSGVTIAESSAPEWAGEPGWTVSAQPIVQIGTESGDPMYQLFRVSAACWLPDDRIAVANSGSSTIRFYDHVGKFLKEVGGEGGGPGEFQRLTALERYGADSLIAFDSSLRRISVLSADGDFGRSVQLQQPGREPLFGANPLNDGTFVVRTAWSSAMMAGGLTTGRHRDPQPVFRYGAGGELMDTIGLFPGYEMFATASGIGLAPFGRITTIDTHDDLVYVGTGDALEIRVYSPEGELRRLVRGPDHPRTVGDADIERYRENLLGMSDDPSVRGRAEQQLNDLEYPERRPPYSQILVDGSGNVWAAYYSEKPGGQSSRWMVFDSSGRLLGDLELPEGLRALEITNDVVLGIWRDELDVEYLRAYTIEKDGVTS